MLDKRLLKAVFSFLPVQLPRSVCVYWRDIAGEGPGAALPRPKISKMEMFKLLNQIREGSSVTTTEIERNLSPHSPSPINSEDEITKKHLANTGAKHPSESNSHTSSDSDRKIKTGRVSSRGAERSSEAAKNVRKMDTVRQISQSSTTSELVRERNNLDSRRLKNSLNARSAQQLDSIIEYLNLGFNKIERLGGEKRKLKKLIRAWNSSYEKQFGRLPMSSERKGHVRELYEEYQKVITRPFKSGKVCS